MYIMIAKRNWRAGATWPRLTIAKPAVRTARAWNKPSIARTPGDKASRTGFPISSSQKQIQSRPLKSTRRKTRNQVWLHNVTDQLIVHDALAVGELTERGTNRCNTCEGDQGGTEAFHECEIREEQVSNPSSCDRFNKSASPRRIWKFEYIHRKTKAIEPRLVSVNRGRNEEDRPLQDGQSCVSCENEETSNEQ